MSDYAAASIGAAAQLAGTAMSISAQSDLMEKTREWNEAMWNKANEYNSPAAQMQRLKDANLNPNLLYGNIQNGNASNLTMQDAYGAKGIGEALSKLDWQALSLNIAKSKQELEGMRLDNAKKRYEVMNEDYLSEQRAVQLAGMQAYAESLGYKVTSDGASFVTPDGSVIPATTTNNTAAMAYMIKMSRELDNLSARTSDTNTKRELNEIKKETQGLINQYKTTEIRWQPWLYGIDAGAKVLNGVSGAIRPFVAPKLKRSPITYNTTKIYQ